jgi:hypothetical protein
MAGQTLRRRAASRFDILYFDGVVVCAAGHTPFVEVYTNVTCPNKTVGASFIYERSDAGPGSRKKFPLRNPVGG